MIKIMFKKTLHIYRQAFSGLDRNIWMLALVMLVNRSGTMVLAFLTLYAVHIGFTLGQGGILVGIYGLGSVTGALIGGKLSDVFGFRQIQLFALFAGGIMFMVLGRMENYTAMCMAAFVLAMVNESFRPANSSAIVYYSTAKNRTQSFALVRLAINMGWGIGSALGGVLASINYQLLFWVDGGTNIMGACMLALVLPAAKKAIKEPAQSPSAKEHAVKARPAYRDKTFVHFLGLQILFAICFFQLFTTIPVFFQQGLHLSEFVIGIIMSMNGVIIAMFEMVIVFKLEGKKPYLILMLYGSLLMSVAFILLLLPATWGIVLAVVCMLFITVSEMISMPFMNSYYLSLSQPSTVGRYAGMYTMAWSIAQVVGSSTGAVIASKIGFSGLWLCVGILSLMAALGYFHLHRRPSQQALQ